MPFLDKLISSQARYDHKDLLKCGERGATDAESTDSPDSAKCYTDSRNNDIFLLCRMRN
jgi:hypothetical protein